MEHMRPHRVPGEDLQQRRVYTALMISAISSASVQLHFLLQRARFSRKQKCAEFSIGSDSLVATHKFRSF